MTFENLVTFIEQQELDLDMDLIKRAYEFADAAHKGQKRVSGEDYIDHPLHTARKLAEFRLDSVTIAAGLLHDVPEDTEKTVEDIEKAFGEEIAFLVEGITKLGKLKYRGINRFAESLRKMFVAMAEDVRVVFIKFADRIHNLETLYALAEVKQQRIAKESIEIYAPIAARLGMSKIQGELEDKAFPYAFPEEYQWLRSVSTQKKQAQRKLVDKMITETKKIFEDYDVEGYILDGRSKHDYSLFKKLMKPKYDRDINKIYDLVALRIVVNRIRDCYLVLGVIHQRWKPMPERIKDYIAQPKPSGYQSLHTTVFSDSGQPVEFQIRTKEMHALAEYGVAAHFHYSEKGKSGKQKLNKESAAWLAQLKRIQHDIHDDTKFIEALRLDIFSQRIFIFTPNGDVIDLPDGANSIDFAYHIHTDIGNHCSGAKVNGKLTDLSQALKSGDMVEIILDKKKTGPPESWLKLAKTHMAQEKIRASIKKNRQTLIGRFLRQ